MKERSIFVESERLLKILPEVLRYKHEDFNHTQIFSS